MLGQLNLWGKDKVEVAIDRLQSFEPKGGYYLAFSGGKDSQCIYHLAKQAGVKFDAHYRVTGIDPPELVRFIRKEYPDVTFEIPKGSDGKRITMWSLIERNKMPPTSLMRYCCKYLKEPGGDGRLTVTGVRWAESVSRRANKAAVTIMRDKRALSSEMLESKDFFMNNNGGIVLVNDNADSRRLVEQCVTRGKVTLNPIIDWEDDDVWEYLNHKAKAPHCELYDEGFTRLGCIGCPLGNKRVRDFERWPKYKELYIKAFQRMFENHLGEDIPALKITKDGETPHDKAVLLYEWWIKNDKSAKSAKEKTDEC